MFATLRCTKDNFFVKNSQYQTPGTAFRPRNLACKNCREKKLRCSRQKDGCNACKENNIQCIYNKQASRRRSKRRAQSPKALTDTARSQSPAGARNLSNETQQLLGASMDTASSMIEDDARNDDAIISISLSTTSEHVDPLEDPHSVFPESDPFPEEQTRPIRPRLDFESISTDTADQILCDSHDILNGASDDTALHWSHSAESILPSLSDFCYPGSHKETIIPTLRSPITFLEQAVFRSSPVQTNGEQNVTNSSDSRASSHNGTDKSSLVDCRSSPFGRDCMANALNTFEAVEVKKSRQNKLPLDQLLSFNKNAITKCKIMLSCQSCNYPPGFNMLLITILRGLTSLLQRVSDTLKENSCSRSLSHATSLDGCSPRQGLVDGSLPNVGPNALGGYIIDSHEERDHVLCTLASLQVNAFALLAHRVKAEAIAWNRAVHHEMISSMEDCFADIRSTLRQIQQTLS